jgi:hypothetical protein
MPEKAAQFVSSGDIVGDRQTVIKPISFDKALAAKKNDPDLNTVFETACHQIGLNV